MERVTLFKAQWSLPITTPNPDTCLYKTEMKSAKAFQ